MDVDGRCQEPRGEGVPPMANMTRQKRIIKKRKLDYDPERGTWSTEEKRRFLCAVKKHGCLDIRALQREVRTKSEESIKLFITHCSKTARYFMERRSERQTKKKKNSVECCKNKKWKYAVTDEAVDLWLQRFHAAEPPNYNETKALPIARAFMYIANFEQHPDPSDCHGVDFKSMYETLYYMLCGLPGKQLNSETVEFFDKTIDELTKLVLTSSLATRSDVLRDVTRIHYPSGRIRKYPGKKQMASHEEEDFLLGLQGYNPLRIPQDYLSLNDLCAEMPSTETNSMKRSDSMEFVT